MMKKPVIPKTSGKHKKTENLILERKDLNKYLTEGAISPQLKGNLKLHKEEEPLREISDATNSPGHELAKALNKVFEPYTGKTKTAINGGKDLISIIRGNRFCNNILASCDAKALYPSIIVEEALNILEEFIQKDRKLKQRTDLDKQELIELARLITECPYFECEFGFFTQEGGTPMGGPLSRLLADLVLENRVEKIIREHPVWKEIWDWVRLIDDTLSAWESVEQFMLFYQFLDNIHPSIKWTFELEVNGRLPIFDILIIREEAGFQTTVYRKPTHSDRYIHYTSSQAWKEKAGCIRTLKQRAVDYCSNNQLLEEELRHLHNTFKDNGYPDHLISKILYHDNKNKEKQQQPDLTRSFHVPYHPKARRLLKMLEIEFNTDIIYTKTTTLCDMITKKSRKPEASFTKNVVYNIPCKEPCQVSYIGQTGKTLITRIKQHSEMCRKKTTSNKLKSERKDNGLAYHHLKTGHDFDFNNTKILAVEKNYWRRLIVEGIEIKNKPNTANLKTGFEINDIWRPFLNPENKPVREPD